MGTFDLFYSETNFLYTYLKSNISGLTSKHFLELQFFVAAL